MNISIVIPTYNRPEQLSAVLEHILASEVDHFKCIEVIVVDDGSQIPARRIVEAMNPANPFRLKYIYQDNAGPAEARNNGFRNSSHEIVLFIDDDILVTPDLIRQHYRAHLEKPKSVVYGSSPYAVPAKESPAYRYLKGLTIQYQKDVSFEDSTEAEYVEVDVVASGNISVEKSLFGSEVYGTGLSIPVSEEFALALKLKKENIPIFYAQNISGWHLQPATIKDSCVQNYKYGLGIAEVVAKMPEILDVEQIQHIYVHNTSPTTIRSFAKRFVSAKPIRSSILATVEMMERIGIQDKFLFPSFRFIVGTFFAAGILEGRKQFGENL